MLTVKAGEIWLDDPEDPQLAAADFTQGLALEGKEVVVLLGHGLGYRVMRLKDMGIRHIFVYEPDADLTAWVREQLPEVLEGVTVVHSLEALGALFQSERYASTQHPTLLSHQGYRSAYPSLHERVVETIRASWAVTGTKRRTLRERIPLIIEEILANLKLTQGAVAAPSLGRLLTGQTAFIVSAGPSLDRNIHLLRQAAHHGVILTNNTALPALQAHNIPVDLLVVVDSQSKASTNPDAYSNVRALALSVGADPALHALPLPRAVFVPANTIGELGNGVAPLDLSFGSSVATACVAVAEAFGAANVVLIGQDCAYTHGRYYASGLGRDDYRVEAEEGFIRIHWPERVRSQHLARTGEPLADHVYRIDVPAWSGEGTIWTTSDLENFRQWFIAQAQILGPRRWNATEGGAAIDGWTSISLEQLLAELPPRDVDLGSAIAAAPPIDASRLLKMRHAMAARLRKGLKAARTVLQPQASAQKQAKEELRASIRELPVWELHARGLILELGGAAQPDPHAILQALVRSGERLLPLLSQ